MGTKMKSKVSRAVAGATQGGTKIGGRFMKFVNSDPEAILGAPAAKDVMGQLHARRAQLRSAGYMPAGSGVADGSPRSTAGIEKWWESHFNRAEFAPDKAGGTYHQMPDDYTPGMTQGRALSENRRTHRMKYTGAGVTVRMPSATAIKRYSKEIGGQTFDLPVEAEFPGGTVSGYVRVTQNGVGEWSVSGLNMPADANAYVSEAVAATLEDRRPSQALGRVEDLLQRRRERIAAAGVKMKPVENSAWVKGMGYNEVNNQMVVQLGAKVYAYHVPKQTFESARDSWAPGEVYNRLVKGRARYEIELHAPCGRYFDATKEHRCPSEHKARDTSVKLYNNRVRAHVLAGPAVASTQAPVIAPLRKLTAV